MMPDLRSRLVFGGVDYLDRTHFLRTGAIEPDGLRLDYRVGRIGELFRRMIQDEAFDASEMSASSFLMLVAGGDDRFVGLPVFPARGFRQRHVYVHADSAIESPADLADKLVGVPEYQITAALWIRAFLKHDFGVHPTQLRWRQGTHDTEQWRVRLEHPTPPGVELERIPEDKTLVGMLEAGELDALATTYPPPAFRAGSPAIRRLFPDYERVERDYFARTGFFPIMHLIVLRRSVYEADRRRAMALYDAFVAAKREGAARLRHLDELAVSDPWWEGRLDDLDRTFGGDAFPYGFTANRETVAAMARYSHEQGLAARVVEPEELFAPETLDT